MKSLQSHLKLLHIQWEQLGNEEISDQARERVQNSEAQLRIESQFLSLTKSKHENQSYNEEYTKLIESQKPSPFFSTYLLMNTIIQDHYQQTDNMLSDLSPSLTNNSYSQIQQNTIESICDCLDKLLQEYENEQQKDQFISQILLDVLQQVGGNLGIYIKNLMLKQDETQINQKFQKTFFNLQKLLKHITNFNLKEKQKVLSFIYQLLLTNLVYLEFIKNIEQQNYLAIYFLFQQYFLQTSKQLTDLSDIELFQGTSFSYVFCQCCLEYLDISSLQNSIQNIINEFEIEINNFEDIHYYLIFNYLTFIVNFTNKIDIKYSYGIIKKRKQQIIQLIIQKNSRLLSQLINQILQKEPIMSLLSILNDSIIGQNNQVLLQYDKILSEELLQIKNEDIISQFLVIKISNLDEYILDQTLNLEQIINLITNFIQLSSYLKAEKKQQFYQLLINFFKNNPRDKNYFKKFDIKMLTILQLQESEIFEQIINIAISNSIKSEQHSFAFISLIKEAIHMQINKPQQILLYLQILVEACKKGKYNQNRELIYKQIQGTRIIDCLINNLRNLQNLIKSIYDQLFYYINDSDVIQSSQSITKKKQTIDQPQIQIEIYHTITYLLYLIYQIDPEKNLLIYDVVQQSSIDLCQIYNSYTINFISTLVQENQIQQNTIYQIINNINSIAHGNEYLAQIVDVYFDNNHNLKLKQDDFQVLQKNETQDTLVENLMEKRVQLKLIYNKFYEISFGILFEIQGLKIDKQFYLQILEYQIMTQISMVLSFQDFLPKFIFYLRLERDQQILRKMQNCIIKVMSFNQEPQLIQQLIETLSYHQSSILQHDLDELRLDNYEFEQIQQAYSKAKLPQYRIPIYSTGKHVRKLVDDIKNYSKVVKMVLEIFHQTYQQWIKILQSLEKKSSIMYFQGGSSSIQIDLTNKNEKQYKLDQNQKNDIKLSMKLNLIQNETQQSSLKNLENMSFGFGSFLANPDYFGKLIIFSLSFQNEQEISLAINKNQMIIIYRQDQESKEDIRQISIQTKDWFTINFQIQNEMIFIELKQYNKNQKFQFAFQLLNPKQYLILQYISLGLNLSFDLQNELKNKQKFQSQFIDSFIMLNQSFEGQISQFDICFDNQRIEFEKYVTNMKQQRINFINKGVMIDESLEFDDVFLISPCNQIQPLMCCQNVYILDLKKSIDFIHKSGGYNIFYMILDVLHNVYENDDIEGAEDIIILILNIFEQDLKTCDQQVKKFVDHKNLQILEDHFKQWIIINQSVSDRFISSLLSIWRALLDDEAFTYLLSILKILDCQQTKNTQIQDIFRQIPIKKLQIDKYFIQLSKIQLFYESRIVFTFFSQLMSEIHFVPPLTKEFFFSYSMQKCTPFIGKILNVDNEKILRCLQILKTQDYINLFSIDLLQIIEKLIEEYLNFKSKLKNEEEKMLDSWKYIIIMILQKQNQPSSISQYFIQSSEVQDKLYELTLSIYFTIRQKQRSIQKKEQESLQMKQYFDFFIQQNQIDVGQFFIKKIIQIMINNETDGAVIFEFLDFLNQLFTNIQQSKESFLEYLTTFFLDLFKNAILKKSQHYTLIQNILKFPNFPILMKNLIPHSVTKKQNSSDLFTYFIIYLLEFNPSCSCQMLYQVHIESDLLNRDSLNAFLSAIYPFIIQFFATKQIQPFQTIEDKQKLLNIITSFLHLEQCFGNIPDIDQLNWNLYAQVMEKGIDLFHYLNILFHDNENFLPQSGEIIPEESTKQHLDFCKKTQQRVMPNGGLKRLMIQLIAPYVRYPQMKKPILNYISILRQGRQVIDQKSQDLILQLFEQEFELPLLITKKYQKLGIQQNMITIGAKNEKKHRKNSSIGQSSIFDHLLFFYALDNDVTPKENEYQNLNEILGQVRLDKIFDYPNSINIDQFELLLYNNEIKLEEIIQTYNTFAKEKNSEKLLQNTFDLNQIENIRDSTRFQIRYSIFKQFAMQYELIHKLWLIFPKKFGNQYDINKSQSYAMQRHSTHSEQSLQIQRDSVKKFWIKESYDQKCKNGLWFFLDEYLEVLYQELDNFISFKEFKYEILENLQLKMQVCHLEDATRRRPQLTKVKMKNIFKPYLKQGFKIKIKPSNLQDSSSVEKSKNNLNGSFTIQLQKSENLEESLSQSIVKRSKRRSSIRSEQVIQNLTSVPQTSSFRKASADSVYVSLKFLCEYITQEGAYQGYLRLNEKNSILIFKSEKQNQQEIQKNTEFTFSSPDIKNTCEEIVLEIQIDKIKCAHQKRFLLQEIAIEIFESRKNYFFNFLTPKRLAEFIAEFSKKVNVVTNKREEFKNKNYQEEWMSGQSTNFQYLMQINTYAGRTYNDLSQYFIFPWVISNYKTQQLDFTWKTGQKVFRDLKLPMGAIQKQPEGILKEYQERDHNNLEENFMYGSHYSNSAIVFNYLIRLEPFNELHFSLQKNKFDVADRLFSNIDILWENSKRQDNKELIPEFYYMPEFLQNINYFDFGTLQSTQRVTDVTLPKWVKTQTAEEFIYRMRQALESDGVSKNLNYWIDLIFGVNNYGKNAIENANLFHYLTYEQNFKTIQDQKFDAQTLRSYISQIYYFGQTPQQLFTKPHCKKTKCFNLFTNQIPDFHFPNKDLKKIQPIISLEEVQNEKQCEIIGLYPFSKKIMYIVQRELDKNCRIKLIESKSIKNSFYQLNYGDQKQSQSKQIFISQEIKIDGCNPQNLFTFIYDRKCSFGDQFDSSQYSILDRISNNLFFCIVGYQDKSIQIIDLKNKIVDIKAENVNNIKRQKRASCVRYHAYENLLAIGALDGWLQVYKFQFSAQNQQQLINVFSEQVRSGITCIDISDLYILVTDQRHQATLFTTDGDLLHSFHIDSVDIIYQCIIQLHFLVFKSNNSTIFIYTINGETYVSGYQLSEYQSKNIIFITPFSSKFAFLQPSYLNDKIDCPNYFIQYFDIFDLKLFQQQLGYLKSEKIGFPRFLNQNQNKKGTGMSTIYIVFELNEWQTEGVIAYSIIAMDDIVNYYFDKAYHFLSNVHQKFIESGIQTKNT